MQEFFHGLVLSVALLGAIAWECDVSQVGDQRPVQRIYIKDQNVVRPKKHVQLEIWIKERTAARFAAKRLRGTLPS